MARVGIVAEVHGFGPVADLFQQGGLGLAHLTQLVHQLQFECVFGHIRPGLQGRAQHRRVGLTIRRREAKVRGIDRSHPGQRRFLVGRGVVAVQIAVDGVLIFLALLVLRNHAVLVEQALEEQILRGHAGHLQRGTRLDPELVTRGGQHIGRGHEAAGIDPLAVGIDRLAR